MKIFSLVFLFVFVGCATHNPYVVPESGPVATVTLSDDVGATYYRRADNCSDGYVMEKRKVIVKADQDVSFLVGHGNLGRSCHIFMTFPVRDGRSYVLGVREVDSKCFFGVKEIDSEGVRDVPIVKRTYNSSFTWALNPEKSFCK